ncbi:hypothetical protein NQ317_000465 [Molorchus minor]|uniref:Uncharacterized protein n=1 Tax=Molorchus minor TaxID=1323400 RepID=A0ABQ9JF97_9CUCU|nr:hypothetical protein NQ317_000465 [Molorchus minor]
MRTRTFKIYRSVSTALRAVDPSPAGSFAANGAASLPTAWPAATHLPAWKKLLKRIGATRHDLGTYTATDPLLLCHENIPLDTYQFSQGKH